jgi:predicted Ser/Thr protein kinase
MLAPTSRPTVAWTPSPPAVLPAPTADAEDGTPTRESVSDLLPGTMLPRTRVEIRGRIGEGGGGVVYRGIHIDLQRTLAIKVTCDRRAEARERFLHEARAATRIESPHVVEVVDFGELPDGRAWYAMEYVPGRSLARLLHAEGGLPASRALALLRMACRGLAATHAAGIVHRDVKPGNFVVRRRDGGDELVIVDFGLAARAGRRVHDVCGTPEYMAPEQVEAGVVDARTDVYALGCCAYEMLTGDTATRALDSEMILLEHLDGLSLRWPEEVPIELREIVERCVARRPEDRFPDMTTLEAALDRVAEAIGAVSPSTSSPTFVARTVALPVPPRRAVGRRLLRQAGWVLAGASVGVLVGLAGLEAASARDAQTLEAQAAHVPSAVPEDEVALASARGPATAHVPVGPLRPEVIIPAMLEGTNAPGDAAVPPSPSIAVPTAADAKPAKPTAAELVRRGRRALARGDRSAATAAFKAALRRDPDRASALAGMADVAFERGDHAGSLKYAKAAVRRAPRSAAHRVRLGDAYYRLHRPFAARREYREADRLGSKVAAARLRRLDG